MHEFFCSLLDPAGGLQDVCLRHLAAHLHATVLCLPYPVLNRQERRQVESVETETVSLAAGKAWEATMDLVPRNK